MMPKANFNSEVVKGSHKACFVGGRWPVQIWLAAPKELQLRQGLEFFYCTSTDFMLYYTQNGDTAYTKVAIEKLQSAHGWRPYFALEEL